MIASNVERGVSSSDEESFCVEIRYQYFYKGLAYLGNKIRFGSMCYNDYGKAQREVDLYTKKDDILIYFDPSNPKESILEPGGSLWGPITQTLFGLVLGVIGLLGLVVLVREKTGSIHGNRT